MFALTRYFDSAAVNVRHGIKRGIFVLIGKLEFNLDSFINLIGDKVCGTTEDVEAADIVADVTKKLSLGHLAPEIKARLNHLRRQSLRNAYLALRILEGRKGVRKRLQQHRRSV